MPIDDQGITRQHESSGGDILNCTLDTLKHAIVQELTSVQAALCAKCPGLATRLQNVSLQSGMDLIALIVWMGDGRTADEVTIGWQAFSMNDTCKMSLDAITSTGKIIVSAEDQTVAMPATEATLKRLLSWCEQFFNCVRDNQGLVLALFNDSEGESGRS